MKIVKLMFTFCCYGDVNVYVMKMPKLPSPMLASVTMCNDKIVNEIVKLMELGGLGYLTHKTAKIISSPQAPWI